MVTMSQAVWQGCGPPTASLPAQVPPQMLQAPQHQTPAEQPTVVPSSVFQQQQVLLQASQNGETAVVVHLANGNMQQQQLQATLSGCAGSACAPFAVTLPQHAHQDSIQAPAYVSSSSSSSSNAVLVTGQQLCGAGMQQPAVSAGVPQPLLLTAPTAASSWVHVNSGMQQGGGLGLHVLNLSAGTGIADTGAIQQGYDHHWVVLGQATSSPPSMHQRQVQVTPLQLQQVLLPASMQQQPQQQQQQVLLSAMQQQQQQVLFPADMQQHVLLPTALGGAHEPTPQEFVLSCSMPQLQSQQVLQPQAQTILLHPQQQPQQLGYTQQQQLLPEWTPQPPQPPPMQQQQQPAMWLQPPPPPRRARQSPLPPPLQAQQQQQQPYTPASPDSSLFFAGVSPVAAPEDLLRVFAQYGHVRYIDLYRPYKGCRTSKGCGVVEFSARSEAGAALEAMHGRLVWPTTPAPMVVEWYRQGASKHSRTRAAAQQQQRQQQAAASSAATAAAAAAATDAGGGAGAGAGSVGGSSHGATAAAVESGGGGAVEQPGQPPVTDAAAASRTTGAPGSPAAPAPGAT